MTGETGHFTGSDCLKPGFDRHGFWKNRHGYFPISAIRVRIGGSGLTACPEKPVFSIVPAQDRPEPVLGYGVSKEPLVSDPACPFGSPGAKGKSGACTGSVSRKMRYDRHGFPGNRHGYFTISPIQARNGRSGLATGPEKTRFGTVSVKDSLEQGLLCAGSTGALLWGSGGHSGGIG